jgi:hypothetical protein
VTYLARRPLAILIPANPLAYYSDSEERDRADVDAHERYAETHGFVYWNVPASGTAHVWINDVKSVYFVRPSEEPPYRCDEVTHKGEIVSAEHFKTKNDMRSRFQAEEVQFLYGTRRKVWELESNNGYDWNRWAGAKKFGFIFLKIRDIRPLKTRRQIGDFTRALGSPNQHVLKCEKYVIAFDQFFE